MLLNLENLKLKYGLKIKGVYTSGHMYSQVISEE